MSKKKSRRARRRRATRVGARPEVARQPDQQEQAEAGRQKRAASIDLGTQYSYVYDDLKRIAILGGTMFAILIALSFVIR